MHVTRPTLLISRHHHAAAAAQAEVAAQECYPYEASDVPFRGLIFHDHSWHWAMLAIHGGSYWVEHPELLDPPPEYWALD
jgi:hypothetical protein